MIDNVNNSAIVHSVIELAHNLGIKVIAEGVETKEVADKLLSMNCDRLQGYYIGSPTEPDKVTQSMQDNILNNFSS